MRSRVRINVRMLVTAGGYVGYLNTNYESIEIYKGACGMKRS